MTTASRSRGFTLVEALVALAVLGAVLAAIYGMVSSQLRRLARNDEQVTLALFAENLLARADLDLARGGSPSEGMTVDGIRWSVERTEVVLPPLAPAGPDLLGDGDEPEGESSQSALDQALEGEDAASTSSEAGVEGDGGPADGGLDAERTEQPRRPPQLFEVRVRVENVRGERFAVSTMRLEPAP